MADKIKCLMFNRDDISLFDNNKLSGALNLNIIDKIDIKNFYHSLQTTKISQHYDIICIRGESLNPNHEDTLKVNLFIDMINDNVKSIGTILFDFQGEGSHNKSILTLFDSFRERIKLANYKSKILWNTSEPLSYKDYDIFYNLGYELIYWYYANNLIVNEYHNNYNRNYLFSFLNGQINGREHRYKMLKKIINSELNDYGLISALDTTTDIPYKTIGEFDTTNKFTSAVNLIKNSYINLISESDLGDHTIGFFITEKTIKPFIYSQIPLILAKPGMVTHLKKYGFDMFDDIIDNSYDSIIDLDSRIEMIYKELLKLKSMNLSEWFKDNDNRFKYNYNLYKNIVNNSSNIHTILTKWVLN
jgi:hypothetical protein